MKTITTRALVRKAVAYADSITSDPFAEEWQDAYNKWMNENENKYNIKRWKQ